MDIYDYIRRIFDDNYQQRRRSSSTIRASSNLGIEMRNGLYHDRREKKRRSASVQQTYIYQFSNSSKRPSNDTIISSQLNSRRASKSVYHMQEL
jgi:hypothetical protein